MLRAGPVLSVPPLLLFTQPSSPPSPVQAPAPTAAATAAMEAVQAKLLGTGPGVLQLYRSPGLSASKTATLLHTAQRGPLPGATGLDTEVCFNVSLTAPLTAEEAGTLAWLLRETFEPEKLTAESRFAAPAGAGVLEVGPRMSFSTAWSANAVSICSSVGLAKVDRVEVSRRYLLQGNATSDQLQGFAAMVRVGACADV